MQISELRKQEARTLLEVLLTLDHLSGGDELKIIAYHKLTGILADAMSAGLEEETDTYKFSQNTTTTANGDWDRFPIGLGAFMHRDEEKENPENFLDTPYRLKVKDLISEDKNKNKNIDIASQETIETLTYDEVINRIQPGERYARKTWDNSINTEYITQFSHLSEIYKVYKSYSGTEKEVLHNFNPNYRDLEGKDWYKIPSGTEMNLELSQDDEK